MTQRDFVTPLQEVLDQQTPTGKPGEETLRTWMAELAKLASTPGKTPVDMMFQTTETMSSCIAAALAFFDTAKMPPGAMDGVFELIHHRTKTKMEGLHKIDELIKRETKTKIDAAHNKTP